MVLGDKSWERKAGGMRGEYWTRCFRVRSEMLESEDGSAAAVARQLCDSPAVARLRGTERRTVKAKVASVNDGDGGVFGRERVEGRECAWSCITSGSVHSTLQGHLLFSSRDNSRTTPFTSRISWGAGPRLESRLAPGVQRSTSPR